MKSFFRTPFVRAIFVVILGTLFFAPTAGAATVSIINSWQDPVPYSFYTFNSHVYIIGSYTLPADWVGTIYIWQDNAQLPQTLTLSNLGGATTKTGSFNIDIGIQPAIPTPHTISIEFFGGSTCFIQGTCAGTSANWTDEFIVPRSYTASATADPILSISYDTNGTLPLTNPAFNFANVAAGSSDTRTLYIRNIGGGTANGAATIAGGINPFYCVGTCTYSVLAGAPAVPIQVQYAPTSGGLTSTGVLALSCTSPNCIGVNANLSGTSVTVVPPPSFSINRSAFTYGTINVASSLTDGGGIIRNTGGGTLIGTITSGDSQFTCSPSCTYSIPSGGSFNFPVTFTPTANGPQNTLITFTDNIGTRTLPASGSGNAQPIISVSPASWTIAGPLAPGQTQFKTVLVSNIGIGIMNGDLTPVLGLWNTHGWHCTGVTQGGVTTLFTDATPCIFTNLVNGGAPAQVNLQFDPSALNTGVLSDVVTFRNLSRSDGTTNVVNFPLGTTVTINPLLQIIGLVDTGNGRGVNFNPVLKGDTAYSTTLGTTQGNLRLSNTGTSPLTVTVTLANVLAVQNNTINCSICGIDIILPAGSSTPIEFGFTPPGAAFYQATFTVCIKDPATGTLCDTPRFIGGQGEDPQFSIHSAIPGGENMDINQLCGTQNITYCSFIGTETVVYGDALQFATRLVSDGINCDSNIKSGVAPGALKHCWIPNHLGGTWITQPWTTKNAISIINTGTGGDIEWRVVDGATSNFHCKNTIESNCTGTVSNPNNVSGTYYGKLAGSGAPPLIYFNPSVMGLATDTITIVYRRFANASLGTPSDCPGTTFCHSVTINLSGTGLDGPHLTTSVNSFPQTTVGSSSTAILKITNDGASAAQQVTIDYTDGPFACLANCGPFDLTPGTSINVTLQFTPTLPVTQTGHFTINSPQAAYPPGIPSPGGIVVTVSGKGNVTPILAVTPVTGLVDYGNVNIGSSALSGNGVVAPITIKNIGAGTLSGVATPVGGIQYKCVACTYGPLGPGMSQDVQVVFVPKFVGTQNDVLNFTGGGGGTVNLTGVGVLGASNITAAAVDFGRVVIRAGNYKEQVVTIFNQGSVDLIGGEITVTGPFTCVPPTPINPVTKNCTYPTIVAGGSVQFTIRFTPVAPGVARGVISLSNLVNAKVRVSGIGVIPSVKFKEN